MTRPLCVIVTGRPASGKSTLAPRLAAELRFPLIARDAIKEGYIDACGAGHDDLPPETNRVVSNLFGRVVRLHLEGGVSVVIEAAFQHDVWAKIVQQFEPLARLHVVVCTLDPAVAAERFRRRMEDDPRRAYYHGAAAPREHWQPPVLDAPTIHFDSEASPGPADGASVAELARQIGRGASA